MKHFYKLTCLFFCYVAFGQEVGQVQPSVMIIPYVKNQELSETLNKYGEDNSPYRSIIVALNSMFNARNFEAKNLEETINQIKKDQGINELVGAEMYLVEQIFQGSRPDLMVKAMIDIHNEGGRNSVRLKLQATELSSRSDVSGMPEIGTPHFATSDFSYLVNRLLQENPAQVEKFFLDLNNSFAERAANGFKITIIITSPIDAKYKLSTEVNEDFETLSDILLKWLKASAYKNNFGRPERRSDVLKLEDYRIPLRDADGNNFSVADFEAMLRREIRKNLKKIDGQGSELKLASVSEGTIKIILP